MSASITACAQKVAVSESIATLEMKIPAQEA